MNNNVENLSIVFAINILSELGGASSSIMRSAREATKLFKNVYVISNNILRKTKDNSVQTFELKTGLQVADFFSHHHIDCVVFFKAAKQLRQQSLLSLLINSRLNDEYNFNIITVVCQQPSYSPTVLTPFEIRQSDHLIFIDKTAYNDSLYSFIPIEKKSWTYLSLPEEEPEAIKKNIKTNYCINDVVKLGRGTGLNKCPRDLVAVYDMINPAPFKKEFHIFGIKEGKNWLRDCVAKRGKKDIVIYPMMKREEWLKKASSFDILLYYIPDDGFSSIDGALGQVMRLAIPVIVCGANAPKERIEHGVNGFIAETPLEIKTYSEMLISNEQLRQKIGQQARLSTVKLEKKNWLEHLSDIIIKLNNAKPNRGLGNISMCQRIEIEYRRLFVAPYIRLRNKFK